MALAPFSPTRLRARREAAGITREELAASVVRGYGTIATWELGRFAPTHRTLLAIARALDCDVADLCEPTPRRSSR